VAIEQPETPRRFAWRSQLKIAVFGSGYVGLVTAACLADVGHDLLCIDVDEARVGTLKSGQVPIFEPGLKELIDANARAGRLRFSADGAEGVQHAEMIFMAVGTPADADGSADISAVLAVADTIGRSMDGYKIIVGKSTVPVGTAEKVAERIAARMVERGVAYAFDVCSNPEFLKEGNAVDDFMRPARIILGTDSERVRKAIQECYAPFNRNGDRLMLMDVRSAELTKYAANAMLATKISFMNEMANLAERLGVDIENVRRGIGSDPRIGYHFIYPGAGYGGSCFPKDVRALAETGRSVGYRTELLEAVEAVNERQKGAMFGKLNAVFDEKLRGKTIAVWGLAFKPNTDDMREAPSLVLIRALLDAGAKVQAFDPEATLSARVELGDRPGLTYQSSAKEAAAGADALAICTEWKAFRVPDFAWLRENLKTPVIVDGRNLYDPVRMRELGFLYFGVGRGESIRR